MFFKIIYREVLITKKKFSEILINISFYFLFSFIFIISIGSDQELLYVLGPSVIWCSALFTSLISLEKIFYYDYVDGFLELLISSDQYLSLLILAKLIGHWILNGLPILMVSPILSIQFGMNFIEIIYMLLSLTLGTAIFTLVGSIGAAFTLNLNSSGTLLPIIVLPLYIPALIFGIGITQDGLVYGQTEAYFSILLAIFMFMCILSPLSCSFVLKFMSE